MAEHVSEAVIRRLPGYYRHLREMEAAGITQVSSQELGEKMDQKPSLVRQDINCFGGFGRQGYGYKVTELKERIGEILNLYVKHSMIILGAGSIGRAVARYPSFSKEGFVTLAMFDTDVNKVGESVEEIPILPMNELENFLQEHQVDIAILALPGAYAQTALEHLVHLGVHAFWNFAPVDLVHDKRTVTVVNVHLSDSLQVLSYKMAHREDVVEEEQDAGN